MGTVKQIPDGSSVVIPMLVCRDVAAEIDFCKTTFGAVELGRRPGTDGAVSHALLTIGPAMAETSSEERDERWSKRLRSEESTPRSPD